MNLTKDKRSGRYIADIRDAQGKRIRLSTKATTIQEAKAAAKLSGIEDLEIAARSGNLTNRSISYLTGGRKVTMNSALREWLDHLKTIGKADATRVDAEIQLGTLIQGASIGGLTPMLVTEAHIAAVLNDPNRTTKLSTRRKLLSRITKFFEFCSAKGWTFGNPARLVPVNMDILSHEQKETASHPEMLPHEFEALQTAAQSRKDTFWEAAIVIGRHTGLRLGDIAQLEWAALQTAPGKLVVWTKKRDKRVELPIEPVELAATIRRITMDHPRFVFPEQASVSMDVTRRSLLSKQFERLCELAKVEGKSFHSIRVTYISHAVRTGRTLEHIRQSVGHSHVATTQSYVRDL